MGFEAIFVLFVIVAMLIVLATDRMRPGLTLLLVAILFMAFGIISPKEMIQGFSNKGMITVAILFLVSEGVRRSGALDYLIKLILPQRRPYRVRKWGTRGSPQPLPKACREQFPGWALLLWGRIHIHKGKRIFSYQ